VIRAVKKTKIAKAKWTYPKNIIGPSKPRTRVDVISFICLTTTKANTKYNPNSIRDAILIKSQIEIPKIELIIII